MPNFEESRQTKLEQTREKYLCHNYHAAFGLLFDKLSDLLALAKAEDNHTAAYSALAQDIFVDIAVMAQYCAEELGLFVPQPTTKDGKDKIKEEAIRHLNAILSNAIKNKMKIQNPYQKDAEMIVFNLDGELLYKADSFIGQLVDE